MIMATEKRKSGGGPGTPSKFQKNQHGGKTPQGGHTPKNQQHQKGGSPGKKTPPPPPKGAKQLKVEVKNELQKIKQQGQGKAQGGPKGGKKNGNVMNKVSEKSKGISKEHKKGKKLTGQKRLYAKLDKAERNPEDCLRALKAEKELGHTGRVFTVKLADPVINTEVAKAWLPSIETAVFPKPVEPRQFFVVFKSNANVKKEVELLKKINFGGGKLTVEERAEHTEDAKGLEQIDPISLYLSNLHESTTREELQKLFKKSKTVTGPKKHGPRVKSATKFAFIVYENAADALAAFKEHFNTAIHGNTLVMRFRRIATKELHQMKQKQKTAEAAAATAVVESKKAAAKKQTPAQAKPVKKEPIKKEPESDEDEDDDDDDEEEDDVAGLKGEEEDSDESGDDEEEEDDDDLEEDEEEEDEDDDDDEDDE